TSNLPPTVQLTSPTAGALCWSSSNIVLVATAADSDGTIQRVEFRADGHLLGQVSTPPYTFVWTNPVPGPHSLSAIAVDNRFGITESATVAITVLLPPPLVSLTQPADRTVVLAGSSLAVTATATSPLAGIDHVGFYVGNQLFAQMYAPPYSVTVSSATPATWELTAVAVDTLGSAGTSAVVRVAFSTGSNAPTTLVPAGATWKYLDDGSNQGTNWITPGFPDSAWKSGPAELGYGDKPDGRPETTEIGFGPNATTKWVTYYFRHAFTVAQAANLQGLTLNLLRDDGAVVYLNGKEVFRSNMPEGPIDYLQLATNTVSGIEETMYYPQGVDAALVRDGTNVLAVEVHQASRDSTDVSFDLAFAGTGTLLAPAILGQPASQQVPAGGTAVFSVDAGGAAPLSYQWRLNDAPIPNATAPVLVVTNAQTGNVGLYQVLITNSVGRALSAAVTLSLTNGPPNPGTNQLSIVRLPTGYRLRYRSTPARPCELQRSVDLAHWDTLATLTIPAEGIVEYLEPTPPANGAYYRVRQP
ncbi:MAG TPA: Ig-like domain-containing protein, partial [Bacillota bacterium]|nr:Ig-like domain-containing protein [Bacillota bacterium]